eukprot:464814-Ditylum_brightwellii.AAC.1
MKMCNIVNATTNAWILGRKEPVLLVVNYAMLNKDEDEKESLIILFELIRHGIKVDLTPKKFGDAGGMRIENEDILFEWDGKKLYLKIVKLDKEYLEELEVFELNTLSLDMVWEPSIIRRKKK